MQASANRGYPQAHARFGMYFVKRLFLTVYVIFGHIMQNMTNHVQTLLSSALLMVSVAILLRLVANGEIFGTMQVRRSAIHPNT